MKNMMLIERNGQNSERFLTDSSPARNMFVSAIEYNKNDLNLRHKDKSKRKLSIHS